jgi:hypothetical protein
MLENLELVDGMCRFRPRGEYSLVAAVDLINRAIAHCRDRHIAKLLVVGTGLTGVPIPSLVDRFLLVEDWAQEARGRVIVALVVHDEYIDPTKFGVRAAADFGLTLDVCSSEADALAWLATNGARPV